MLAFLVSLAVVLSTPYSDENTNASHTAQALELAQILHQQGFENIIVANHGISKNSIRQDAVNLTILARTWQKKGYRIAVIGYSRGGNVALYAQTIMAMNASKLVLIEAPIRGAPECILRLVGQNMSYQGAKDLVRDSQPNQELQAAFARDQNKTKILEISGFLAQTFAGGYPFDTFMPVGNNIYRTWQPIHLGKGWLEPEVISATTNFLLNDSRDFLFFPT